ncbi:MAG TPA: hypothetical protein VMG59_06590 [Phycisphaerae bacterium]|nr:hypothetical protein [Phycisphaerae bacterium]
MNLSEATTMAAIICLAPLVLYLIGLIRDPFNPLLIISGVTFGTCVWTLSHNPGPALEYAPDYALIEYENIVSISLLFLYAGWLAWRFRNSLPKQPLMTGAQAEALYRSQYSVPHLFLAGWLLTAIAVPIWFLVGDRSHISGYVTWLTNLRFPGAVLAIQSAILDRRLLRSAILCVIVAAIPSLLFFISYGGRADTASLLVLVCVAYLLWQKRPPKLYVVLFGALFAIILGTLAETRSMPNSRSLMGRVTNIYRAGENLVTGKSNDYGAGYEFIVGADTVAVVDKLHNFDDGAFLWNIGVLLLPKEYFPYKDDYYTDWYTTNYLQIIRDNLAVNTPVGAAPTGFANVYVEFGWLFPLVWFLLGYWMRSLHTGAVYRARLDLQGCLVIFIIVLLFLIAQDLYASIREVVFNLFPLYLIYQIFRYRKPKAQLEAERYGYAEKIENNYSP